MSQTPRHINTDRSLSRPDQAARAPQAAPEQNTRSLPGRSTPRRPAMQHSPIWAGTMHRAAAKKRKRPRCGCPLPS